MSISGLLNRLIAIAVAALCVGDFGGAVALAQASDPQIAVEGGVVAGRREAVVESFKGIPFAAPPVGENRWRAPQPVVRWTGVRQAAEYGHDCMQEIFAFDAAPPRTTPSEDCLYLNVWRPAKLTKKAPVIVWIYGGGFVIGGTSPAVYDGRRFAEDGVVFVSMNYRIGRFGFFGFPALTAEAAGAPTGNFGYLDQIAALKWVKANIAAFGGDASNVTVFGESAGGGSVHMLLTSPLAKNLFKRAIIESGGGRGDLVGARALREDLPGAPSAEKIGVAFAKSNGIEGQDGAALAALRALPADKVGAGVNFMTAVGGGSPTYAGPMRDGQIVVQAPDEAYRTGQFTKTPLIVGANDADLSRGGAASMDEALAPFGKDRDAARALYDPARTGDVKAVAYDIGMDRVMIEPARLTAAAVSARGARVYEYRFSYVASGARQGPNARKGAGHASEIPYVFDTIDVALGDKTTAADRATAKAAHAYWVNFAKTGNPNAKGAPAWPAYNAKADVLMNFTQDGPKAMVDPLHNRLDLVRDHAADFH